MKIVKLRVLNINSLKGSFEIDFEEFLQGESLFAITGATGAGKSTLLDVITCALYGKTPRLTNPNDLMSRHTGECLCEVEFEVKKRRYLSSWSQKRARKKSNGKFQTAKMEVVDLEKGAILESKLRAVPKVIEELTGLDFDRFIQSMMLAQGSFDAFLKAKEAERSTLLEKITGTFIYKRISQEVYEIYTNKRKEIESDELALGSIELLEKEVLEQKHEELEQKQKSKRTFDKEEAEIKKVALWLENIAKLEGEVKNYTQEFETIAQEKEKRKLDFLKLEQAEHAQRVELTAQEKGALQKSVKEESQRATLLQTELEELKTLHTKKLEKLNETKVLLEKERASFEKSMQKSREYRTLQTQLESKVTQLQNVEKKLKSSQKELTKLLKVDTLDIKSGVEKIREAKEHFNEELTKVTKSLESIKNRSVVKDEQQLRDDLSIVDELLKALQRDEELQEQIISEQKQIENYEKELAIEKKLSSEKEKLVLQIEDTLLALQTLREKELLIKNYEVDRARLQESEACYLCGSKKHPYKEVELDIDIDKTTKKLRDKEYLLQKERSELQQSQMKLVKLDSQLESATLELEKLQNKKIEVEGIFSRYNFKNEEDAKLKLQEQREEKERKLQELLNLRDEKERLVVKKERLQKELHKKEQLQVQVYNIVNSLKELESEQKELEVITNKLEAKKKAILDVDDIESFEKEVQIALNTLQEKYSSLEMNVTQLDSKRESLTKQREENLKNLEEHKAKLQNVEKKFDEELKEYSFSSLEEFEKALLSKEDYQALKSRCNKIKNRYKELKTLKTESSKKLQEQKSLQLSERGLEGVEDELQELQKSIDEVQRAIGSLEKELEIDALNRKKHKDKIKLLEEKKDALKVWIKLNEMIGSANGDKFSKFAQGITLDQLIYLANRHLKLLSPRYELQRSLDTNRELEIEVVDGFQANVLRAVSTLSGGESFIVSLSLALGLSTLASQKISIDSLFLDEGFGTLDSDSLELALNALNQLQSSGKMVGVISHVETLKERIPKQIKVKAKGDGTSMLELL